MYADSVEGANPVQKVTLTQASQFAFGTFYFQSGGGYTSLSQTLSYTGGSNVTMGAPFFIFNPSGPATSTRLSNNSSNGSTFTQTNVLQLVNVIGSTFTIDAATGPIVLRALQETSTGVLAVSKTGNNVATIAGPDASNYRGAVQITAGTLNANSATALGLAASTAVISVTSGATLSLGAAPTYSSRSLTLSGTGSSSAPNNGALIIANTGTSAFQSIALGATGTYIRATNSGLINAPFTTNNNSVVFGASAGSDFVPFASLSNVFSGMGAVTYGGHSLDTGIVRADVRHTYTGNTTLAFGTTYVNSTLELPGTGGPLGNRSLTAANTLLMTGGTLTYLGGSVDYSGRFSTAGSQQWKIDAYGQTVTYATALVGASSLALSDTSTGGSLTLSSASSTFSGGVTLTSGTLFAGAAQNGVSGPLGITGTVTFSPAGTGVLAYTSASAAFDYSSRFATTDGQTRRINANGQSVTFSTAMGGTNAFALVGTAGTLTLAVANTYTQGTTISVGTLKCGNAASLGTGGLAQANNTTLHVTATGGRLTIQGAHTNTGTGSRTIRIGG
jgi:autotransporter family porin